MGNKHHRHPAPEESGDVSGYGRDYAHKSMEHILQCETPYRLRTALLLLSDYRVWAYSMQQLDMVQGLKGRRGTIYRRFAPAIAFRTVLKGARFPESAQGRIVSLHEGALNISFGASPAATDPVACATLGSLVLREIDMTASSLLVRSPHGRFRMDGLPVSRGDSAVLRGSTIVCAGKWAIDLGSADETRRYDGCIAMLEPADQGERLGELTTPLAEALIAIGRQRGFAPLAKVIRQRGAPQNASTEAHDPFVRAALAVLAPALAGADPLASLEKLIGLGVGLTPSGDDFVVGALAARALSGLSPLSMRDRAGIERRIAHTTIAGATIVRDALDGSFPEYLRRFAGEIADVTRSADHAARTPRIVSAVMQATEHGHSSGTDAVTGFTFGLTTWQSEGIVSQ